MRKNLFKIPVIHTNLNCCAEFPPPLQGGWWGVGGGRGAWGSDIAHELKFCFFN